MRLAEPLRSEIVGAFARLLLADIEAHPELYPELYLYPELEGDAEEASRSPEPA
jgi:hypothetical protein